MTVTDFVSVLQARGFRPEKRGRGWSSRCPAHDDRNPSLSISEGHGGNVLLHCFTGCSANDIVAAVNLSLLDLFPARPTPARRESRKHEPPAPTRKALQLTGLESGTSEDHQRLAALRGLPREAIEFAVLLKVLRFGDHEFRDVETTRVWALGDASNRITQLRRLDGAPCRWFSLGEQHEAKSYTWPGSTASWPVGLGELRSDTPHVLLVEGGPDLLAACAILAEDDRGASVIPAAMLGGSSRISIEALSLLSGCHVRLVPHLDAAGAKAESRWAQQLGSAAASVDVFDLSDEKFEGKDLNDFVRSTTPDRWKAVLP